MPLEAATYITDLVPANPVHTDPLSQADSHMRLTKQVLKNTFPNVSAVRSQRPTSDLNGFVPVGGIILWAGSPRASQLTLRSAMAVGGVPDLRDRFVIGAGGSSQPRSRGSLASNQLTRVP
jgi:hypothetical protein